MFKEELVNINQIAGLGSDIVKFVKKNTDEVICFIGKRDDKDVVYFQRPVSCEDLLSITDIIGKKKMQKALSKGNFEKAQKFANKTY